VRRLFAELEAGRYPRIAPPRTRDELRTLVESANELSARLESMETEIRRTERLRILAQLAGGFAHQLRNAVTGARMAVQLHQRQCAEGGDDECLNVALAQLKLTEQQVQGLLSLSQERPRPTVAGMLSEVISDVAQLLGPHFRHMRVQLHVKPPADDRFAIRDRDLLRAALLNLGLNAMEAAGVGGTVWIETDVTDCEAEVRVIDNGAGVPAEMGDRVFEPFVTTKPEGVGLGLALAQEAAKVHDGLLDWTRSQGRTQFRLRLSGIAAPFDSRQVAETRREGSGSERNDVEPETAAVAAAGN
jgi:signal transduction histidine kinase